MAQPSQKDCFSATRIWANAAALVAIALLASSANDVRAQQSTTILNTDLFGFLSQHSLALGREVNAQACVPTTTTNYMIYLQNKHPQSLGYQMAGETRDDWIEDAEAWAHLMGTNATGTDPLEMVRQVGLSLNACIYDGECDSPPIDSRATISYTLMTMYEKQTRPFPFPVNGAMNGSPPPDYRKVPRYSAFIAPLETHQTPVSTGLTAVVKPPHHDVSGHRILVTGITNDKLYFIDPLEPYGEADPSSGLSRPAKPTIGTLTTLLQTTPMVTLGYHGQVVHIPAQSLILHYEQYHCQLNYMSHTCIDNSAKEYPNQCTRCPDPNASGGGCPVGQYCISAHQRTKYLLDSVFWINFNDPHPAAANVTQQVATSPLTAAEIEERHKFANCTAELHQAHESDQACRTRAATQKCNDVLSSTVQGVTATNDACGRLNVTQVGEHNHGSAIRRLAAANVDIEDIGRHKFKRGKGYKKYKCSNEFGRAISKHTRCEHSAQRMERSGLDASRKRTRCDRRLRKHFEKAVNRYGRACPYPADPSLVISTNREESTPLEVHEMLEARNRF